MSRRLLAVDGGGTGCRARLADADGRVLGEGRAGPANLTTGFEAAIANVTAAYRAAASAAGLDPAAAAGETVAVLGLAGAASLGGAARAAARFPFARTAVRPDSEIACLGAHGGEAGGLLVLGTGSQAVLVDDGGLRRFGGWGFLLSDGASGAVLGQAALRAALAADEGLAPRSPMTEDLMARFGGDPPALLAFSRTARPADYAAAAPVVFAHAAAGDPVAGALIDAAVRDAEALIVRLQHAGAPRIAIAGGLAELYRPRLAPGIAARISPALGGPLDGALALARRLRDATGSGPRAELV